MSLKNASMVVRVLILTLDWLTTSAVASTAGQDGREYNAGRAHSYAPVQQMDRHAGHDVTPHAGYAAGPRAASDFGYVFVPGRGLLGEDCDMPTSACPNEMRVTQ